MVALALAMSIGAATLSVIVPPNPMAAAQNDPDFFPRQARTAARIDRLVEPVRWNLVEIAFGAERSRFGVGLVAQAAEGRHFTVAPDGIVESGPLWRAQHPADGRKKTIIVEVLRDSSSLSVAQWIGLRTLLTELYDITLLADSREILRIGFRPPGLGGSAALNDLLRRRLIDDGFSVSPVR